MNFEIIMYWKQVGRVGRPDEYCCKLFFVTVILEQSSDKVKIKITKLTIIELPILPIVGIAHSIVSVKEIQCIVPSLRLRAGAGNLASYLRLPYLYIYISVSMCKHA